MSTDQDEIDNSIEKEDSLGVETPILSEEEGLEEEEKPQDSGKSKAPVSSHYAQFLKEFEQKQSSEEKIRLSIDFMRSALTQQGTPRFRDFWEGRRLCLPLFKENIVAKSRSQLWGEYIELSSEARRLKEILDEQSQFAVEQIELAIQALERDIEHYDLMLSQVPEISFDPNLTTLKDKQAFYSALQRELQLLNTLAARINSLRKEIIKTEMRIRTKNKLFERLSACGDQVFPKRKDQIKEISNEFTQDVVKFVQTYFQTDDFADYPLYALREEIKALQSIAKTLTLNTHSFTETRLKLSECWDKIKVKEKERKKEMVQKKQAFKQNYDLVVEKIQELATQCQTEITLEEANRLSDEILTFMRSIELGRDEVRSLKDEIHRARHPIVNRSKIQEDERNRKEREAETQRRERISTFKSQLHTLVSTIDQFDAEQLASKRDDLLKEFSEISLSKAEKQIIERQFKQLKDTINEKKERALLDLSEDDLKSLEQFEAMLEERKERRQEIKTQLETYRKALGGSGFDFEKAMMYREMIEAEKSSLEKINASIEEIEEKISGIEGSSD